LKKTSGSAAKFVGIEARGEDRQLFTGNPLLDYLARLAGEAHQHVIDWLEKGLIDPEKLITHTFDYHHVTDAIELFENVGIEARGEDRQLFTGNPLLDYLARLAGEAHQHDARRRVSSEPSQIVQQGITGKELAIFSSRLNANKFPVVIDTMRAAGEARVTASCKIDG
jgi:hypothetical protein